MNTIRSAAASLFAYCLPTDNSIERTKSPSNNQTPSTGRQHAIYHTARRPSHPNLRSHAVADAAPTVSNAASVADESTHQREQSNQWPCVPAGKPQEEDSSGALVDGDEAGQKQYQADPGKREPRPPLRRGSTASLMEDFFRAAQGRAAKHISPSLDAEIPPTKKQFYTPLDLKELEALLTEKEIGALRDYIQHGGGLSYAMRNKIPLTPKQKEMLIRIQSALAKIRECGGSYPGLLHRGMSAGYGPHDNSHVKLFKEGGKFEELGLMSASSKSNFVDGWHDGIKLTVAAPENGDIIALNPYQMEALCEPAKYDVLLTAFDRAGVFRALISEESVPPEGGKAKRYQCGYEGHLIRPAYELHREADFLSGKIPSDAAGQRRHLIMNLTLGFNSILKTENFQTMCRRFLRPDTSGASGAVLTELRKTVLTELRTIFDGPVTQKTPVEVAAAFVPLLGTKKMEELLKSLDDEVRHLKDTTASRNPEPSHRNP